MRALGGVLLCALLLACAPDRQPASGTAAEDYFPLVQGARWKYRLSSPVGELDVEVKAVGDRDLPRFGPAFIMEERNLGPDMGFVKTSPVAYLQDDEYHLRLVGLDYKDDGELVLLGEDFPVRVLPTAPEDGHTWQQSTRMFGTPEGGGGRLGWNGAVKRIDELTVPAGTFQDVLVVETLYIDESESIPEPQVAYRDYYARGVGLIKSETDDMEESAKNHMEQQLLEYRFPR